MISDNYLRIRTLTANTFVEALRQRFFAFLILLAVMLAVSGTFLRAFDFGNSELAFIADFGFGGMFFFGSILAIVMTVQLFFSELDNRTALTLLARPVHRWEFFLGKFMGVWILLGVFVFVIGIVLAIMLTVRTWELSALAASTDAAPPWFSLRGLAVFVALQWVRLGVVSALTLFVCSLARTFLYAVIVSAMFVLACQLLSMASAFAKTADAPWLQIFLTNIHRVLPDLQMFDLGVPLVLDPKGLPASVVLSAGGSGLFYIPMMLFIGVLLFRNREI